MNQKREIENDVIHINYMRCNEAGASAYYGEWDLKYDSLDEFAAALMVVTGRPVMVSMNPDYREPTEQQWDEAVQLYRRNRQIEDGRLVSQQEYESLMNKLTDARTERDQLRIKHNALVKDLDAWVTSQDDGAGYDVKRILKKHR